MMSLRLARRYAYDDGVLHRKWYFLALVPRVGAEATHARQVVRQLLIPRQQQRRYSLPSAFGVDFWFTSTTM